MRLSAKRAIIMLPIRTKEEWIMKRWTSSWRYVPVDYGYELGCYENTTQTATFRNNLEGTAVRVRLNNRYAEIPMEITHGCP